MKHIFKFLGIATLACLTWSCADIDKDEVGDESKLPNAVYIEGADVNPVPNLQLMLLVVRVPSQHEQQIS